MYIAEAVQDLAASLAALTAQSGTLYVAHGRNRCAEGAFLTHMARWDMQRVANSDLHPRFIAPDVSVLRFTRKRDSHV